MGKRIKVNIFFYYDNDTNLFHVSLTESQVRLLKWMHTCLGNDFDYEIIEEKFEWMEV